MGLKIWFMSNYRKFLPVLAVVFLFHHFSFSNAYAYIDPGTGSAIIAMIISVFAGIAFAIKLYWEKLKYKIRR